MTAIDIPPVANRVYDAIEDEELREGIDALADLARTEANWAVRKATLLGAMVALEKGSIEEGERTADPRNPAAEIESEELFIDALPVWMAAILERLDETKIACVEQAAFYLLSAHPEHQQAAEDWIDANDRNEQEFRTFLRTHRDYEHVLSLIELAMIEEAALGEDLDDVPPGGHNPGSSR